MECAPAEQYVQQPLRAECGLSPAYRLSESSRTEPLSLPDGGSTQLIDLPLYAVCRIAAECAAAQG